MLLNCKSAGVHYSKQIAVGRRKLTSSENIEKLIEAAQYLNDLLNEKGVNVYVNSLSGFKRNMTVILIYMCLFK